MHQNVVLCGNGLISCLTCVISEIHLLSLHVWKFSTRYHEDATGPLSGKAVTMDTDIPVRVGPKTQWGTNRRNI